MRHKKSVINRRYGNAFPSWLRATNLALVSYVLTCTAAVAQVAAEAKPAAEGVGADIKAYVAAPLHWDRSHWLAAGSVLAATSLAYQYDNRARAHFVSAAKPSNASADSHDLEDAVPAALILGGTWLAAAMMDDRDGRSEAASMVKAAALSTAATYVFKTAIGRRRPYEEAGRDSWHDGGDSFPSAHAAAAFAIGTVFAESGNDRFRWLRRVLGYGMAAGTAYSRIEHDVHWLSDTVAGASLGVATAQFLMQREQRPKRRGTAMLLPTDGGLLLSYSVPLMR